jgi:hypothetical protein
MFPFDDTRPDVYGCPYSRTGKGNATCVVQSSQWLPTSVVPGISDTPLCVVRT